MNATYAGLLLLVPLRQNNSGGASDNPSPKSQTATVHSSYPTELIPTVADHNQSVTRTRTSRTGSTVWGPGALTGKLLKWVGKGVQWSMEYMILRNKLSTIEKTQPDLLASAENLTRENMLQIQDQCSTLIELCIIEMNYPTGLMTRAFKLILNGFKLPGRQIWSYYIAEAISGFHIVDIYEFFLEGFFVLLDDSIFRLKGFIDHETLCFRCPIVAHEIAAIISHLARKDQTPGAHLVRTRSSLSITLADAAATESVPYLRPTFSRAIIEAGFFRLVKRWGERGLPHWDQPGIECLEDTLQNVADAQGYHGDVGTAEEAKELMHKVQRQRLRTVDEEAVPEIVIAEY